MIETFRRACAAVTGGRRKLKSIAHLLSRTELHLVLFVVALVAFMKPIVLPGPADGGSVMAAFFVPWGLVIVALVLIAIAARIE